MLEMLRLWLRLWWLRKWLCLRREGVRLEVSRGDKRLRRGHGVAHGRRW